MKCAANIAAVRQSLAPRMQLYANAVHIFELP